MIGESYLAHHGVKGMKWGVRHDKERTGGRFSKGTNFGKKGGVLKKGTAVSRVALTKADKTFGDKKYVSTNFKDHDKWVKELAEAYAQRGRATFNIMYTTTEDIRIASNKEAGKIYMDKFMNSSASNVALKEVQDAYRKLRKAEMPKNLSPEKQASYHLAMQTDTGKKFINELIKQGYGGVADTHGQNTSKDPLIIFNPDKKLSKQADITDFTSPTKKLLEKHGLSTDPNDKRWS